MATEVIANSSNNPGRIRVRMMSKNSISGQSLYDGQLAVLYLDDNATKGYLRVGNGYKSTTSSSPKDIDTCLKIVPEKDTIETYMLQPGCVNADRLGTDSVITNKILNGNVTAVKLNSDLIAGGSANANNITVTLGRSTSTKGLIIGIECEKVDKAVTADKFSEAVTIGPIKLDAETAHQFINAGDNVDNIGVSGILSVEHGGTGNSKGIANYALGFSNSAKTESGTRNLKVSLSTVNSSGIDWNGQGNVVLPVTGILPENNGGTGNVHGIANYALGFSNSNKTGVGTRNLVVDLGNEQKLNDPSAGIGWGGTNDVKIPVKGTLPITNGGTGNTTGTSGFVGLRGSNEVVFRSDGNTNIIYIGYRCIDGFNTAESGTYKTINEYQFCNGLNSGSLVSITAASYNAKSDRRLKKNIKTFKSDKSLLELPIVRFKYKSDNSDGIGCIAQDLKYLFPEMVTEDENGYLSVKESKLVYLLINECKKLRDRIDKLEKRI